MRVVDLQRRVPGERADGLLERLQRSIGIDEPVVWNESGHARIELSREREDARQFLEQQLDELSDDWAQYIAIL